MTTLNTVNREIEEIEAELKPLHKRKDELDRKKRLMLSLQFIEVNRITRDDIEMSEGAGKTWFGHLDQFVKWMKDTNSAKRFCEWNGRIYFTSDLMHGKMPHEFNASIDDLPKPKGDRE